jgi:hypothetical protein
LVNVVLVTRSCVFSRYLAASLYSAGSLDAVIVETGRPSWTFLRRKLSRVGPANAVFQVAFNRWFRMEGSRHLPNLPLPPHRSLRNVNSYPFAAQDVVIGFGTSFITAATLARMANGFLNLHTGWLPEYRGVKSEFWTLAAGDCANVGWTLHYMTPRLDDGDIVLRRKVPYEGENPPQLRAKLLREAVPVIAEFTQRVRSAGPSSIERFPQGEGRYHTTPTWSDWRRYRARRRASPSGRAD